MAVKIGSALLLFLLAACAVPAAPVASAAKSMNESIAGTRWVLPGEGEPSERPRLEFGADGRVSGYTGCNQVGGGWRLEGGVVRVGPLMMTKRACPGERDEMERRFLKAVNSSGGLSIEGGRLVAVGEGGERLELAPDPAR